MVLGIDDLQHQSALRLAQRLNERAVAFLDLPLRRRQLRWGAEAVIISFAKFVIGGSYELKKDAYLANWGTPQ